MVVFPFAKVNLGLHVIEKRADGYHAIESVLLPIPLHDILEVVIDKSLPNGEIAMTRSGVQVPGDPEADLCWRAVRSLDPGLQFPGLRIHLHKVIPIGAGLGGGSSDGAHTLMAVNTVVGLHLPKSRLHELAAGLGSDCPFFLHQHAQLATGRGEVLKQIDHRLHGWYLMLIAPDIHISTAEVYAHMRPAPGAVDLERTLSDHPPEQWPGTVVNVMEGHVLKAHPAVAEAKQILLERGAVYASMSGSGSSVFGLFKDRPQKPEVPGQRAFIMRL